MNQNSESNLTIRVRVKGSYVESMRSQPLHHTQREVATTNNYADFECYVAPTPELYSKLLSYGNKIEVREPREVRMHMYNLINKMSSMYNDTMLRSKLGKAVLYAANMFPKADASKVGLALEMHRDVSLVNSLNAAIMYLEAQYGWEYIKGFRLDDPDTLKLFELEEREGLFVFESKQLDEVLRNGVSSIEELVTININHHHPESKPKPYDHALVQTLIAYHSAYIKCHYPREYDMLIAVLSVY